MPGKTPIEWADLSWNPVHAYDKKTGKPGWHCEHVSDGCDFCYSETRNKWIGTGRPFTREARDQVDIDLDEKRLLEPMPKKPSRIFVCDMTDLFGPFIKEEWIDRILEVKRPCAGRAG
jgi:protein gp37